MVCVAIMRYLSGQMSRRSCEDNMVRLISLDRTHALGMVQTGTSQEVVARHFNVHQSTISRLLSAIGIQQIVNDRAMSGRPRVTAAIQIGRSLGELSGVAL